MPRQFNEEPYKAWKIHVKATTAGRIEHLFMNPVTGKPDYGARGKLINTLLEQWLAERGLAPATEPQS